MAVKELVSPAQVARAIGVGESTLKRWCDDGRLPVVRTAGGHRRLPIHGVLRFLRDSGYELVDPAVLGLPCTSGQGDRVVAKAREMLREALLDGDEAIAQQVVMNLFMARVPIHRICDEVITTVFHDIGEMWTCREVNVYQERRGCEIALRVLLELRTLVTRTNESGPIAIGGTISGDHYTLPTTIVEVVLREAGWQATSLGTSLPFETLAQSIDDIRPNLFWLSVSHIEDVPGFVAGVHDLRDRLDAVGAKFVLGGRALETDLRDRLPKVDVMETFTQLRESNLVAEESEADESRTKSKTP